MQMARSAGNLAESGDDIVAMTEIQMKPYWPQWMEPAEMKEIFTAMHCCCSLADDDNADLSDGTPTTWQSWKLLQNMVSPCWLMQKTHAEALEPAAQDVGITIEANLAVSFPAYLAILRRSTAQMLAKHGALVLMDAVTGLTYYS